MSEALKDRPGSVTISIWATPKPDQPTAFAFQVFYLDAKGFEARPDPNDQIHRIGHNIAVFMQNRYGETDPMKRVLEYADDIAAPVPEPVGEDRPITPADVEWASQVLAAQPTEEPAHAPTATLTHDPTEPVVEPPKPDVQKDRRWECPVCNWRVSDLVHRLTIVDHRCPGCGMKLISEFTIVPPMPRGAE